MHEPLKVLLNCLGGRYDSPAAILTGKWLKAGDQKWEAVLKAARHHSLLPLLATALDGESWFSASNLYAPLRMQLVEIAVKNLMLASELARILELLSKGGIRVIALKGPVLATSLHGTPCLREFSDLDILVSQYDAERSAAQLEENGYLRENSSEISARELRRRGGVVRMVRLLDGTTVELHSQLTPSADPLPLDFETLRRHSELVPVCGTPARTLGNQHLLLFLCVHGAKHYWSSLRWVADVAELVHSRGGTNWPAVIELANEVGCRRILLAGVLLACNLFNVKVPEAISKAAASDSQADALVTRIQDQIFSDVTLEDLERLAFAISVRERWRDRFQIWYRFLSAKARPNVKARQAVFLPASIAIRYLYPRQKDSYPVWARLCNSRPDSRFRKTKDVVIFR